MESIFCCTGFQPYRSQIIDNQAKFDSFISWAKSGSQAGSATSPAPVWDDSSTFVIQLVRQVNFGPIESKRYFVALTSSTFTEVTEQQLIDANYQKVNS